MVLINLSVLALGLFAAGSNAIIPITGPTGGVNATTGERPMRKEINGFYQAGGPAWDLYIQCLAQIQARPQSQIDSWYQIAGIHGRPYIGWDGGQSAPGSHGGGYCPHSAVLFPTWHRPYLALMEQTIVSCAQTLAAKYPAATKASYTSAATTLRMPYWDWAKVATLPPVTVLQTIKITTPTGTQTIQNPLYHYVFNPKPSASDFPPSDPPVQYKYTVRSPTPNSNGMSNSAAANAALTSGAGYLHDTTYLLITRDTNYPEFSNIGYTGTMTGYGSIENPHGAVHNYVGGDTGHMTYLDYSAFDPIFWLHHANVDRFISIWQALNPDSFTINQTDSSGTYSITANTVETEQTPLGPFHSNAAGSVWTSTTARSTRTFGYTYPEVIDWNKTPAQLTTDVRAAIRALYDPNGALGRRHSRDMVSSPRDTSSSSGGNETPPLDPSPVVKDGKYHQWQINIRVNKFETPTSFKIYFFTSSPISPSSPSSWDSDPSLVASYPVLRTMSNPTANPVTMIFGIVPLTRNLLSLVAEGRLENLDVEKVVPYLTKNLQWRVVTSTGEVLQTEGVKSLKVYVLDQVVRPPKGASDFPSYGRATPHREITEGKAGGLQKGDSY